MKGHILLLVTIAISMFLDGLDGTIVNVALPDIAASFGIGTGGTSWVITVYYLMMAGLILIFGRLCDLGALKRILISGMIIFTAGSLFCGLSPSFTLLLASRAFQGIGAAMLAASAVMIGVKYLPKEKIGLSMSLVVLGTSLGVAVGPSLGAVLTQLFSWHWIFFINVPIGIMAVIIAKQAIPADKGLEKGDIDYVGSIILFVSIVSGLFALERIPSVGLNTTGIVALVCCIVLFIIFCRYERGKTAPVLKLSLFRNRNFDMASSAYVLVNVGIMGVVYILPFFFRKVAGLDALGSGMLLSLQAISMIICCLIVGKLSDKIGDRPFSMISCLVMVIFTILAYTFDADISTIILGVGMLVCGMIWGIGGGPMGARMIDALADQDRGAGSSMISFIMYFSSALGTALFAGLFGMASGEGSGSISDISAEAFMDGYAVCLTVAVIIAILAFIVSSALKIDRKSL